MIMAFLFVTIIPLSVTVYILFENIRDKFESDFSGRFEQVKESIKSQYNKIQAKIDRNLLKLTEKDGSTGTYANPTISLLLIDLKGDFYRDPLKQNRLMNDAVQMMKDFDFDVFRIVDKEKQGKTLAVAHLPGFSDTVDQNSIEMAEKYAGEPFLKYEKIFRKNITSEVLTLEVARIIDNRIVVVGGTIVDRDFLENLRTDHNVKLVIYNQAEQPIVSTEENPDVFKDKSLFKQHDIVLKNIGARQYIGKLTVYVSKQELHTDIERLITLAFIVASSGIIISFLLGIFLSRRIVLPLKKTVEAAHQVANGHWDISLDTTQKGEIGELVESFNKMTEDLQDYKAKLVYAERVAAWKDIARQIAHEIKNPLFPIQTSIETLQKAYARNHKDFDEIFHESTKTILEEVERMKRIVTEFSTFARMPKPQLRLVDLNTVIRSTLTLYRGTAERIQFQEMLAEDLPMIMADEEQLNQVFINLITNAIDALDNQENAEIHLITARKDDRVEAIVRDNGCGIQPEAMEDIFKPYFTLKKKGTGLGLAIVYRIITDHHAKISVMSIPRKGTEFILSFPV
jgi:signal transduction histidine kinase